MEKENNNSKQIILSVLGVAILIVAVVGVSFAAFTFSQAGTKENVITTGTILMSYNETNNGITINNAMPMSDTAGKALTGTTGASNEFNNTFTFTVSATISGSTTINYEVAAIKSACTPVSEVSGCLADTDVKLYLEKGGVQVAAPANFTSQGASATTTGTPAGAMILDQGTFSTTDSNSYVLRMWMADTAVPSDIPQSFAVKVNVYGKAA